MKTISIIALKGGVGKTITAINMAHILATRCGQRVLLVDNDKQGNTSKFFDAHSYERPSTADILTVRGIQLRQIIRTTLYKSLDVLPANMHLLNANLATMLDQTRPQQTRFRAALNQIEGAYDYCIIDNAPDINISTINALVASDEVIIPITVDEFALDGLKELLEQIGTTREELNPNLRYLGCLITAYRKKDTHGRGWPESAFTTKIRWSSKVTESTFAKTPIADYSRNSAAAVDYIRFVTEYLKK